MILQRAGVVTLALSCTMQVMACASGTVQPPHGPGGDPPPAGGGMEHVAAIAEEPRTESATASRNTNPPDTKPAPDANVAFASTTKANAADSSAPAERPKQITARHVLIQYMGSERAGSEVLRTREQALALAEEVLRRARAGEDLGRLAVEYSDEPNAAARGGSLGRFGQGQMVPAFEAAAFKLKVGEISDVVATPFGFHVIQRTE
ncbi:MAG: peptidyl-prolyl cis-trans isomerase [Polyangiaceae bacterium]|nr:peptidyl-prolyl cis-trans isomerase [Polyangiaceae bacterium]